MEEKNIKKKHRGVLIVFEGIDKSGKSTQVSKLVDSLILNNIKVVSKRFPDRTSKTGKVINSYLQSKIDLDNHEIHRLFSDNRRESQPEFKSLLESGTSIIVDRYSFSGIAYSAAKEGMDYDWCCASEAGFLKPDIVFFLKVLPKEVTSRGDYSNERYENETFQEKVMNIYSKLNDISYWITIDGTGNIDNIHKKIHGITLSFIEKFNNKPSEKLWEKNDPVEQMKLYDQMVKEMEQLKKQIEEKIKANDIEEEYKLLKEYLEKIDKEK